VGRGAKDVLVQAGDAEPWVQPAGFDRALATVVGELVQVCEELFGREEGGVAVAVAAVSSYATSPHHAVEHCFDVADHCVRTRGGA